MTDLPENVNSPNCGGAILSEERQATHLCKNKLSRMEKDAQPVFFTNTITREQAFKAVQAWWSNRLIDRNLSNQVQIVDCQLNYFPFWKLKVHVTGTVKGYRIESEETYHHKVPMDAHLDNDLVWTGIACDPGDLGIYYVRNMGGETVSCEPCTGRVAEVTVRQTEAFSEGTKALKYGALRYADIPNITRHMVHIRYPRRCDLIVYPFWTIRYAYRRQTYFATIDGVTGDPISGRAPGNFFWRVLAFVAAIAVSILGVLVVIYFIETFLQDPGGFVNGILGWILLLAFFAILIMSTSLNPVLNAFALSRYGSEITLGDVNGGYRFSSEHVPPDNDNAIAGIFLGFGFMLYGGFVFLNEGKWLALITTIAGLVIYIISCMYLYQTAWGTTSRSWISDAHSVKIQKGI